MKKFSYFFYILLIFFSVIPPGCTDKTSDSSAETLAFHNVPLADENSEIDMTLFTKYYGVKKPLPQLDLTQSLEQKTIEELRLLKQSLYARHGYLFPDATLRSYFNKFEWYQPIFWDKNYKFSLSPEEKDFHARLEEAEKKLLISNFITVQNQLIPSAKNIVNKYQYKDLYKESWKQIETNGFTLVPSNENYLFNVAKRNALDTIPSFISTDFFLEALHLYYFSLLKHIEEERFYSELEKLLLLLCSESIKISAIPGKNDLVKKGTLFNSVYFGVPLYILTGKKPEIPALVEEDFEAEVTKIKTEFGKGSNFLDADNFDYSIFRPYGRYATSDKMKRFFRALAWLRSAPVYVEDNNKLAGMVWIAHFMRGVSAPDDNQYLRQYRNLMGPLSFICGESSNTTISDIVDILFNNNYPTEPNTLFSAKNLTRLRQDLAILKKDMAAGRDKRKRLTFFANPIPLESEIYAKLNRNLTEENTKGNRGLDVFAAFGNPVAENLILNFHKDQKNRRDLPDSLKAIKQKIEQQPKENLPFLRMSNLNVLVSAIENSPSPFNTPNWRNKSMLTSLAGWTKMRQNNSITLSKELAISDSTKKDDRNIPPAILVCYVEPNINFWSSVISVLEKTKSTLEKYKLSTPEIKQKTDELKGLAEFLLNISKKEISKEAVNYDEFNRLKNIGFEIEKIVTKHQGVATFSAVPEEGTNNVLYTGVGFANTIFVSVEINGWVYLTRGATYSYYELTNARHYTDNQWLDLLAKNKVASSPEWAKKIISTPAAVTSQRPDSIKALQTASRAE